MDQRQIDEKMRERAEAAAALKFDLKKYTKKPKAKKERKQRVIKPKVPKGTIDEEPKPIVFGPEKDPAIAVHRRIVQAKKSLLRNMCMMRFGRTPDEKRRISEASMRELATRESEFWGHCRRKGLPRFVASASCFAPSQQFDRLRVAYRDQIIPCDKGHQMLLRHSGIGKLAKCKLCWLSKPDNPYTTLAYQWFRETGFDDIIFEWKGPPDVIPTGGRFRFDVLVRMNNGDIVSVEFDDQNRFNASQTTRRSSDVCKHNWALVNGLKVVRFSETDDIQRNLALAFPDGPNTVLDQVTFVGPGTWRYYYLDGHTRPPSTDIDHGSEVDGSDTPTDNMLRI